ncbi:LysR family transcriptional regulator [Marinomonas piezotolerans]|uniref:LysR family transcriptional regulator n=1 Tax=Marinomonas piezotolerans TaxID=2213058 RepID=A0A370UC43_9GAMM|nr:LysR family transcriptional regulator [Marinomonas piezotolerans]RDL45376.1 LysR family transcriptional regulator [Marinomonas piezotolerans]
MNHKRLETFVWVASLGSFRKAAERMHTTQPAISARIANLESELGVKLFEREVGSSPIVLTAKGKDLLPYAEKILYQSEQLRKRAGSTSAYSGVLRLGVSETIAHTWLSTFLGRLHSEMPNLDVELTVEITSTLSAGIKDRSIDLGFLMGPLNDPNIVNLDLCTFSLSWAASPQLDLPDRLLYLEELSAWPIISYARNSKPFVEISHKFRELDGPAVHFFTSTSLAACRSLALDGVGIATMPDVMIKKDLEEGSLKRIRAIWTPTELKFTASYSNEPFNPIAEVAARIAAETANEYAKTLLDKNN